MVVDVTGVSVRFETRELDGREVVCGYCGVGYHFQLCDGVCGCWVPVGSFVDVVDGFGCCRGFDFKDFYRIYGERWV